MKYLKIPGEQKNGQKKISERIANDVEPYPYVVGLVNFMKEQEASLEWYTSKNKTYPIGGHILDEILSKKHDF